VLNEASFQERDLALKIVWLNFSNEIKRTRWEWKERMNRTKPTNTIRVSLFIPSISLSWMCYRRVYSALSQFYDRHCKNCGKMHFWENFWSEPKPTRYVRRLPIVSSARRHRTLSLCLSACTNPRYNEAREGRRWRRNGQEARGITMRREGGEERRGEEGRKERSWWERKRR